MHRTARGTKEPIVVAEALGIMDPNLQHSKPSWTTIHGRRARWSRVIVLALAVGAHTGSPRPFQPRQSYEPGAVFARQPARRRQPAARPPTLLIEISAPTANLFARAEEGVERKDWKLATDSLQRIIDAETGSLVPRSPDEIDSSTGLVYESTRKRALRWIAEFEPEGLKAYRLLYDGRAKRLFDRAQSQSDPADLRAVVDRYLLTRYGDDAADLLASWMLDVGQPTEAVTVLQNLREMVPDYDVPEQLIAGKLAAAYAMQGRIEEANSVVESFRLPTSEGPRGLRPAAQSPLIEVRAWLEEVVPAASKAVLLSEDSAFVPTSWPMSGGSPARLGRMTSVAPNLVDPLPWQFAVRSAAAKAWERAHVHESTEGVPLPAAQLVADEYHIFVRTPHGCAALDVEDLSVVWSVPAEDAEGEGRGASGRSARHQAADPEILRNRVFEDYVSESITIADGLVMIVQRSTEATVLREGQTAPVPRRFRNADVEGVDPTLLVALEADTGQVRWWRGRTFNVADPLGDVEFRSVPVKVGDALWVPYLRQSDLFVAALDPADGSLVHNILLCSLDRPTLRAGYALSPAYSDGTVFIPSGHGVLFAVDARKGQLRWANRYLSDSDLRRARSRDSSSTWLSSPPIVSRGVVLLAPRSRSELMAFDAASGNLRWSSSVQHASYMIAADEKRIWVGGDGITCLSLIDGRQEWSSVAGVACTGRAVVAGDLIHLPTVDGVITVDAGSGERLRREPLPPESAPLGNLLSLRSRLFSVEPSGVRMYPDLSRLYPEARIKHEANPSDTRAAVQLAWMEILRDAPKHALQVLDETSRAAVDLDGARRDEAAHVRVEALLALADRTAGDPAEALDLLRQALHVASTSADRLHSGLALADRLAALNHHSESFRTLWQVGLSGDAYQLVSLGRDVKGSVRGVIAARLRRIGAKLSADEQAVINRFVDQQVAGAIAGLRDRAGEREAAKKLRAAADLDRTGSAGQHALIALADWRLKRGQNELAEQLLLEAVRSSVSTEAARAALTNLCGLYLDSTESRTVSHDACLRELESRLVATTPLDTFSQADLLRGAAIPDHSEGAASQEGVVTPDLALEDAKRTSPAWRRSATPDGAGIVAEPFLLTDEVAWSLSVTTQGQVRTHAPFDIPNKLQQSLQLLERVGPPRTIRLDSGGPLSATDLIVFYAAGDMLYSQRVLGGELVWYTQLRLPDQLTEQVSVFSGPRIGVSHRAVTDGRTAVFNGIEALHGVGFLTGKRLWVRPYEPVYESAGYARSDTAMAARDGFLAALPGEGHLALMRMADGRSVWERDLHGRTVAYIWMTERLVVTADRFLQHVEVFDRRDGARTREILFKQPDPEQVLVRLIQTGDLLCGPECTDQSDDVVGVDLDAGQTVWRMELNKPLASLFGLQKDQIGIGLLGGDVRVVDTANGETKFEGRIPGANVVFDGLMTGNTLIVKHTAAGESNIQLSAIDVSTGELLWHRDDLATASRRLRLDTFGDLLPAVVGEDLPKEYNKPRKGKSLALIDIRTGANVGPQVELPSGGGGARFNGDLAVYDGSIVIGTTHGIHALITEPLQDTEEEQP